VLLAPVVAAVLVVAEVNALSVPPFSANYYHMFAANVVPCLAFTTAAVLL
jgi:hypothetical protein